MRRSIPGLTVALIFWACGGGQPETIPVPADPENAIRDFLGAVQSNDLATMANIWGTARGPASSYMKRPELEQRLSVIRAYLVHESYEVLPPGFGAAPSPQQRELSVRLTRRGCRPTVPFTLRRYGDGWLITSIDLAAAGNPARACRP